MKAVFVKPFREFEMIDIDEKDSLEVMQRLVNGYIEIVPMDSSGKYSIILNDEGKLRRLLPCAYWFNDVLVGNLIFVKNGKDGEFTTMDNEDIDNVKNWLDEHQVGEF